jgi:hypothetical protein
MAVLNTTSKEKLALKGSARIAKRPALLRSGAKAAKPPIKLGFTAGKPLARWRARRRLKNAMDTAQSLGAAVKEYGPEAARLVGALEEPKQKRTAPRVAAGVVIGASAVYFLDPKQGAEHRQQARRLVTQAS